LPLPTAAQPSGAPPVYVVDLDITGGFTGRGRGGVTVTPDGIAAVSRVAGTKRDTSTCRTQLSSDERRMFDESIATARKAPWPASFTPPNDSGCCDRMKWTLRLVVRQPGEPGTFVTTWFDGNGGLPPELRTINEIAQRALARGLQACTPPGRGDRIVEPEKHS
jgi:hypothetical protein